MPTPRRDEDDGEVQELELPSAKTHLMVTWPVAAIGALVLAIAAGVGLLIVVTKSQALATVAIILAIIAFVVQIIVFIVQVQAANSQALRAQALHGELERVLAQIQERTEGTQKSLVGINEKLLAVALRQSLPEVEKDAPSDDEGFARNLAARTVQTLQEQATGGPVSHGDIAPQPVAQRRRKRISAARVPWPRRAVTPEDEKALAESSAWPTPEEARDALGRVEGLSDRDVRNLIQLAEDDFTSLDSRNADGIRVPGYGLGDLYRDLVSAGLVAPSGYMDPRGTEIFGLTPHGRVAGRLVFAPSPVPDGMGDERLRRLREALGPEDLPEPR